MIDPGGNWIRISQLGASSNNDAETISEKTLTTKLSRAIVAAELLAESKGDPVGAAKLLDNALAQNEPVPAVQRVQAWVARAALALTLSDAPLAKKLLSDVREISLNDEEQKVLAEEIQRAADLEQMLP